MESKTVDEEDEGHHLLCRPTNSVRFEQARRYAELTAFEFDESPNRDRSALHDLESTRSHAEDVFASATSLTSEEGWNEWQQPTPPAKIPESELRRIAAKRIEHAANSDVTEEADSDLSIAFARWTETMQPLQLKNSRVALVSQIVTEVQQMK